MCIFKISGCFIFQQLNFTGFRKILKKHDKVCYKIKFHFTVKQTQLGPPNVFSQSEDKFTSTESDFYNQQINHREGQFNIADLSGNMLFL